LEAGPCKDPSRLQYRASNQYPHDGCGYPRAGCRYPSKSVDGTGRNFQPKGSHPPLTGTRNYVGSITPWPSCSVMNTNSTTQTSTSNKPSHTLSMARTSWLLRRKCRPLLGTGKGGYKTHKDLTCSLDPREARGCEGCGVLQGTSPDGRTGNGGPTYRSLTYVIKRLDGRSSMDWS